MESFCTPRRGAKEEMKEEEMKEEEMKEEEKTRVDRGRQFKDVAAVATRNEDSWLPGSCNDAAWGARTPKVVAGTGGGLSLSVTEDAA
ncbi:unnamed protein product [Aureobasidium pullulans]|nr:unnamed protein product [Aureobasidium pullulans]